MRILDKIKLFALSTARRFPRLNKILTVFVRRILARGKGYPDWKRVLSTGGMRWSAATQTALRGPKVLVATSTGSHLPMMHVESVLAAALRLRGANVHALLCDAVLPGCMMCEPRFFPNPRRFVDHGPAKDLCGFCYRPGKKVYDDLGITLHPYSEHLTPEDKRYIEQVVATVPAAQIENFELDGLKIGEHAKAGALRFFARAMLEGEQHGEAVLRNYFKAALLTALSTRRLMRKEKFEAAVFHHGIYVPQGIIGEVARQEGVRVVNWTVAYRRDCFIFSHGDTYHHTLMDEPVANWENLEWTPEREQAIDGYLRSRWQGDRDWLHFHDKPFFERERILAEIGCDTDRPIVGCLTNVMWDAQLHYPANAFPNMLEWLLHTVRYFALRPDLQLVIRVHPAELRGSVPTRQPVADELKKHFPQLPSNVYVVPPDSNVSTYVLCELCDSVVIYGTKTGVELTSEGIPVIVAGEAWIRNKGVTSDATSIADYDRLLERLPLRARLAPEVVKRARKYAYHFFFQRMIPVKVFDIASGWPPFRFAASNLAPLEKGGDPGLDFICEGILTGAPFVFDAIPARRTAREPLALS